MKRCPQCDFIYLDIDEVCDLDGTKLVHVNDAELPLAARAVTKPAGARSNVRPLVVTAVGGVVLGAMLFVGYLAYTRSRQVQSQTPTEQVMQVLPTPVNEVANPSPEPSPDASPSPKTQTSREAPKRIAMSKNPVSTSTEGTRNTGQIWIKLSNGSRIEADEVWRTKEGLWYRRNGVVTLIKPSRVKAIEKAN